MATTLRPNRINIDLQGYKQPWLDYCKAHGVTPSDAFRQIVAKLTSAQTDAPPALVGEVEARDKKVRKELRLTASEVRGAEAIAKRAGFSLTRWIVALIRARLGAGPQLGQDELETLARSNLQMLAIGRNLNQLAKAANSRTSGLEAIQEGLIDALRSAVRKHAAHVSSVMSSNVARWTHR